MYDAKGNSCLRKTNNFQRDVLFNEELLEKNEPSYIVPSLRHCCRRRITVSVITYAFVLLYVSSHCEAEYLCGSRLVDALRFICGSRGINGPGRGSYMHARRGSHLRKRPEADITVLCCERGCTMKQMERFCGEPGRRHQSRRRGYRNRHRNPYSRYPRPPHPPTFNDPPATTSTELITTTAMSTTMRQNATTAVRSTLLDDLRHRYRSILERERARSQSGNAADRKSIFHDIVKVASELFRESNTDPGGSGYEYEYHDRILTASFHVNAESEDHH
uniref:Insulin-like 1 n=1 Tax=Ciona intestinalis TaxID=7719 RepID=Q0GTF8_CIOIN|nr:insulin-like 1 precursor [Ciona intestinalis]ABG00258.1 insulin-like 1 precursor [Ciona intestinalis]|eukprot:NP_001123204.1 insulin-like 1 precursor [Ciona intestinalis]